MTQRDVCEWLATNPGWHPTAEIVAALQQGYKGVQVALSRASMWGDIESRKGGQHGQRKEWRAKA
jgi:hypothetical protein